MSESQERRRIAPAHTLMAALGAVILAAGCAAGGGSPDAPRGDRPQTDAAAPETNADGRLAAGVWEGVIPAADCPGIRVALYIRVVGTYTRIDTYVDRNLTTVEDGRWSLKGSRLQLTPLDKNERVRWAEIDGDGLRLMDIEGRPIEGPLAQAYVLRRQ